MMFNYNLDYDEGVIIESEDVSWTSRNDLDLTNFVLTNKNLYCIYEKSNGLFKKPTVEQCVLSLSDVKIINGQALVQQAKHEGSWCLQIQFRQGTEYFEFTDSPKKVIPQWVVAINNTLGTSVNAPSSATYNSTTIQKPVHQAQAEPVEQGRAKHSFCVNCGNQLSPGTKFCPSCGHKVGETGEFAQQQKAEPPVQEKPIEPPITETKSTTQSNQRQQEYVGKVFKCPHCGEVVNQSDTVCSSCGYHLSGKQAMGSAMDFQQQLLKIEMMRQDKKIGFWDRREALDATDKQMIALIKSYPIPNTIEDIVEFFHLAIGNIDVAKSKKSVFNTDGWDGGSRERVISNAWVGKLQQIYKKAELYFPNEIEFSHIKEAYKNMMKKLKLS